MKNTQSITPFQMKLKEKYKKQDTIAPLIEGLDEIKQQSMKDYYVKLQTIIKEDEDLKQVGYESVSGEKKEIEIEKIFDKLTTSDAEMQPNKLLILGGAGVGKSTLMQYMAYKWGNGEIWNDKFDYVYRITLKTLLDECWLDDYQDRNNLLKCLAHYHLTSSSSEKKDEKIKLEDMEWPVDNSKVLLLLDGYDEVAHLRNSNRFEKIFGEIYIHPNLILSSRPNAIDSTMLEKFKFNRKIVNTGLDNAGIEQYFKKYFNQNEDKSNKLHEFLEKNASIKDICKIPVNIAILCYVWSEDESSEGLIQKISGMSDLYSQVIDKLGFRYFSKWKFDQKKYRKTLEEIQKAGSIELDELKVLKHVAYKGMTGGGVNIADKDRIETLIIKGAIN